MDFMARLKPCPSGVVAWVSRLRLHDGLRQSGRLQRAGGVMLGQGLARLFGSVELAAFGLGEADIQAFVDGLLVSQEPFVFSFYEVKSVGQEFARIAERAGREHLLDAGFRDGIEDEAHGESVLRLARNRVWRRGCKQVGGCGCAFVGCKRIYLRLR
jgi:hypothetical protein